ncbi:50S ribosomal protein L10 [Prochlorothrix hollandica]|uniref:Large ribosomal subunit protein uL10 n=1 Tax=Prochlorothrix hollandica PCC 9006 = CALU 1027 TaxID=317619 RepID=A0A0M2Q2L6_PROHO|nr:50S ribosomal protein L10 [Prochlorothrix hollandica]KKJ00832.1 50S ribosomal protein L10 [Prochlorothrix hollandica PCC 9006 = CALU 1027]
MGRSPSNKREIVADLKAQLDQCLLAIVVDYAGLSVSEITQLRDSLYPLGASCKVTKNTLMRIAIEDNETWKPMQQFLNGTNAFLLIQDDLPGAIKAYQAFQKATKKTAIRGGAMEGTALSDQQIAALTELPTKEELYARIAGGIKAIPTKLAVGTNAVPTKLAVGIKEVPNKLARALQAVADKDPEAA